MIVGIDFDGTIVDHQYPRIGDSVPNAIEVIKELKEAGHTLILYTMRSGKPLAQAVMFCNQMGIQMDYVNENPDQSTWTTSPKVYCNIYIDDAGTGPTIPGPRPTSRHQVDWLKTREILVERGFLAE